MAGTRTAPAFTAAADGRAITLHLVDASGDNFTERLVVAIAATAAAIEAWAAAYAAFTNSSLWKITEELLREGDKDPDNAVAAYRGGVENGINLVFKDAGTTNTFDIRGVAPIPDVLQGNQDIPLLSSTEAVALITTTLAIAPGYTFRSAQYTTHRERRNNARVG